MRPPQGPDMFARSYIAPPDEPAWHSRVHKVRRYRPRVLMILLSSRVIMEDWERLHGYIYAVGDKL